ncbi:hypothetical protein NL676_004648 [Syzygium grande]|nr:hypothetical protein NL676_004648 [Syzygium grande]
MIRFQSATGGATRGGGRWCWFTMGIKNKAATIVLLGRGKLENIDQVRQERTRGFAVSGNLQNRTENRSDRGEVVEVGHRQQRTSGVAVLACKFYTAKPENLQAKVERRDWTKTTDVDRCVAKTTGACWVDEIAKVLPVLIWESCGGRPVARMDRGGFWNSLDWTGTAATNHWAELGTADFFEDRKIAGSATAAIQPPRLGCQITAVALGCVRRRTEAWSGNEEGDGLQTNTHAEYRAAQVLEPFDESAMTGSRWWWQWLVGSLKPREGLWAASGGGGGGGHLISECGGVQKQPPWNR